MKRTISCEWRSSFLGVGAAVWSAASLAAQPPTFSLRVLNDLSGVGGVASVSGINNAGEAVGSANGGPSGCPYGCAVVWGDGAPTMLGSVPGALESGATSINGVGQVAGFVSTSPSVAEEVFQAVIWNDGTPTFLPSPAPQYVGTFATAINDAGQVVGEAATAYDSEFVPILWNGLVPTILGATPDCPPGGGYATGINNNGLVVGTLGCQSGQSSAAVYWIGTTAIRLPAHPTAGFPLSGANAVNDSGLVVGMSNDADNPELAPVEGTSWANGVVTNLGPIPAIQGYSNATAVNNRGMIVGETSFSDVVNHAVLWTPIGSAPQDLNDLIGSKAAELYVLTEARGINDSCTIVANGYNKKTRAVQAFMLKLTDPSRCVNGL